jgi:predicted ribosomally synthesized peptide with SipW-like signal peptide
MKRNLILAVVVVAALSLAGAGGVFATWSDSEVSFNNTIATGSLDLKVNGADDAPWGEGVPAKVTIECMIPQKFYGPYEIELWNAGQCQFPSHAYIHFKDMECSNVEPKVNPYPDGGSVCWYMNYGPDASTGYPDPSINNPYSGDLKPEPELVAEYGGKVDCTMVPGVGVDGDDCSMGSGVRMMICNSTDPEDVLVNPEGTRLIDLFYKWECQEIWLFDLMPCQPRTIYLYFYLIQEPEEDFGLNLIKHPDELGIDPDDEDEYAAALLHWKKFNDWPSWRYMKDKITFDIEFDLWLEDTPGAIVSPDCMVDD